MPVMHWMLANIHWIHWINGMYVCHANQTPQFLLETGTVSQKVFYLNMTLLQPMNWNIIIIPYVDFSICMWHLFCALKHNKLNFWELTFDHVWQNIFCGIMKITRYAVKVVFETGLSYPFYKTTTEFSKQTEL